MITNEQVLGFLKEIPIKPNNYYCGVMDDKKECSFGVYNLNHKGRTVAIGTKAANKTAVHGVSLLVHWNQSTRESQAKAIALYEALEDVKAAMIGGKNVNYISMLQDEPVDVGRDSKGICEYVIEFLIYYERG